MEKKESKEMANIKLSYLDLFPSYEEIDENNEGIIISFPNCNLTCNLVELIKNREEISVPHQIPNQSIKINLLKSNNPYATGLFTVKSGDQWVTFTYEHKKKQKQTNNFALSLIDCIKIKFLCKIEYVPTLINTNNQLANTEIQTTKNDSVLSNIITKPSPKKLYGNYTTKKSNHNNNMEHDSLHTEESKISKIIDNINPEIKNSHTNNNLNNTTLNSSKNTNNPLLKSENISEFLNPLAAFSGVIGKDFKSSEKNKNKNIKKIHNNNLKSNNSLNLENKKSSDIGSGKQNKKNKNNETLSREKTKISNNNSLNNIANTIDNKNITESKSKQNLKRNKSKNIMDNKNKTNKKEKEKEKQIKNTNNQTNSANIINNNNNEQKSKKIKRDLSSKNLEKNKEEKGKGKKNEKKEIE